MWDRKPSYEEIPKIISISQYWASCRDIKSFYRCTFSWWKRKIENKMDAAV